MLIHALLNILYWWKSPGFRISRRMILYLLKVAIIDLDFIKQNRKIFLQIIIFTG